MNTKLNPKPMSKEHCRLVNNLFIANFIMGICLTLIGSELPMIKSEYQLSYQLGGTMMSIQSIGYLATSAFVGILPRYIGAKKTYLILGFTGFIGLTMITLTGNPIILLFAMFLTGISKGSNGNFGSQVVGNLTDNNASILNLLQAFFAVGACAAPLIAMLCGISWRTAFYITIVLAMLNLLYGMYTKMGQEAYVQKKKKLDYSFFKLRSFWICALIMGCYLAIEACVMGWLVTYFVDTGCINVNTAQIIASSLWVAVLVGRIGSAWLANYIKPYKMIAVMVAGVTVCFTGLMLSYTLVPMAVSTMGLGLFMAGMYATALANTGDLTQKYPMCMGMLIAIPGLISAIAPNIIGTLADCVGIRSGMYSLYLLIAALIIAAATECFYQSRQNK